MAGSRHAWRRLVSLKLKIKDVIVRLTHPKFGDKLDAALNALVIDTLSIRYTGGAFIRWEIKLFLFKEPKTLRFR